MVKINMNKSLIADKYWIRYTNEVGMLKQVNLTGCANNFALSTNNAYDTGDGLRCVGWRYEEDGSMCYELFCVGHLVLCVSLRPSLTDRIRYLLRGRNAEEAHRETVAKFEKALNERGWKTIEKPGKAEG